MTTTFTGAVLCGGASRRMGRDKATLVIGGQAMARRVSDALHAAGATSVVAIGGNPDELAALGLQVVPDEEPGAGPLAATITALRGAVGEVVVVLACDLVAPSALAVTTLVERLEEAGPNVDAAVPVVDGVHQWTHAAWRRGALDALVAARASGATSLRRAAEHLAIHPVGDLSTRDVADADDPFDLPDAR